MKKVVILIRFVVKLIVLHQCQQPLSFDNILWICKMLLLKELGEGYTVFLYFFCHFLLSLRLVLTKVKKGSRWQLYWVNTAGRRGQQGDRPHERWWWLGPAWDWWWSSYPSLLGCAREQLSEGLDSQPLTTLLPSLPSSPDPVFYPLLILAQPFAIVTDIWASQPVWGPLPFVTPWILALLCPNCLNLPRSLTFVIWAVFSLLIN